MTAAASEPEWRSLLLEHRLLARLPHGFLALLLREGQGISLQASESLVLSGTFVYFVLEGSLGVFAADRQYQLTRLNGKEDVLGPQILSEGLPLAVLSPSASVFRLSLAAWETLLRQFPQAQRVLWPCQQSLKPYLFCKALRLVSPPAPALLEGLSFEVFAAQEPVFQSGDPADKFYLITQGRAQALQASAGQAPEVLKTLEESDYFGEMGLLQGTERAATILAQSRLVTLSLGKADFMHLLQTPVGQLLRHQFMELITFYAYKESYLIGSAADCEPRIQGDKVAPHHIKISKKQDQGLYRYALKPVCDPHRYPIYVNRQPIVREVLLNQHDELVIGNYRLQFDAVHDQVLIEKGDFHTLEVTRLSYAKKQLPILTQVSFRCTSNQLVGILGASGSGKSTLLDLLSGAKKPVSGEILYDQVPFNVNKEYYAGIIGFVPQENILFSEMTVFENLYFAAKVRYPLEPGFKIRRHIDQVLEVLKLSDKKHVRLGSPEHKGLSGGQLKRVNIARELIFDPDILLLDEPTSGLSSRDAEEVTQCLRILADMGKMVIAVMHQPSSRIYKRLDQIVLLDEAGTMAYAGPAIEALTYLAAFDAQAHFLPECPQCQNVQPEKLLEVLDQRDEHNQRLYSPDFWQQAFRNSLREDPPLPAAGPVAAKGRQARHFTLQASLVQLFYLIQRSARVKFRDRASLGVQFATPVLLVLLLAFMLRSAPEGLTYAVEINPLLPVYWFVAVILAVFMGVSSSARDIVGERAILAHEISANLKPGAYVLAKFVVQAGLLALQLALFLALGNTLLGIQHGAAAAFAVLWLSALFGLGLGLLLSALAKSTESVINLIPLILIPQILLGGAQIPYQDMNKAFFVNQQWPLIPEICHLMPSRWAYESLVLIGNTPRQTALAQIHVLRDDILLPELTRHSQDKQLSQILERRMLSLDQASGLVDQLYPEHLYPHSNEALDQLVQKGIGQYYHTALKQGLSLAQLEATTPGFSMRLLAHPLPVPVNWAFCAPEKSLAWGTHLWAIRTLWFNQGVLLLMTLACLLGCVLILRLRSA